MTLAVNYGRVWLNDSSGLLGYTGGTSYATSAATVTLTGGLDALNNALRNQNVRYQGNPNYNSRNRAPDALNPTDNTGATDAVPNDVLTITINDLLNTDILNRDANGTNNVTTPLGTARTR